MNINEDAMASATTRLQECLHAVGYAMRQTKKRDITFDDLFDVDLFGKAYDKYCEVDMNDAELFTFIGSPTWADSVIESTNAAKKSGYLKKNTYVYHRGSVFMHSIYQQASILMKKEGVKMAGDKWNPSDIWASTINSIPNFGTLAEYNEWISKMLHNGKLVGISLKKIKGKAKVTLQSPSNKPEKVGFGSINPPREFLPTGVRIRTSKPKTMINFRSFRISHQADIQGEIIVQGGVARHGKVPSSLYRNLVKEYNIPQIDKARIEKSSDSQLVRAAQNLWKQIGVKVSNSQMEEAWQKRKNEIQDRTGYWQSILHSLELAAYLNNNRGKADDIIGKFFTGGSSVSEWSSEYIKVY